MLHELGHIPVEGESVELRAFNPDAPLRRTDPVAATVARMDGRRIDLLDLVELGAPDTASAEETPADE